MSADADSPNRPWEPVTFKGVAGFATAPLGRLLAVELAVAAGIAIVAMWFVATAWMPVITEAVARLPDESVIRDGRLEWPDPLARTLAEGPFLSIRVDPRGAGGAGQVADLQLEIRDREFRLQSLLGYATFPYPRGWTILLNRAKLEPWWGAWRPAMVAGTGLAVVVALFGCWAGLAAVYAFAVRWVLFFANRQATRLGCWKLASTALMPGALLVGGALILYGLHRLTLVGFLFAFALHLVVGWVYVLGAPLRLPRAGGVPVPGENPFAGSPPQTSEPEAPAEEGPQ